MYAPANTVEPKSHMAAAGAKRISSIWSQRYFGHSGISFYQLHLTNFSHGTAFSVTVPLIFSHGTAKSVSSPVIAVLVRSQQYLWELTQGTAELTLTHSYHLPRDFWPSYPKSFLAICRQSPNSTSTIPKNSTSTIPFSNPNPHHAHPNWSGQPDAP